jgi:hypothetical protein
MLDHCPEDRSSSEDETLLLGNCKMPGNGTSNNGGGKGTNKVSVDDEGPALVAMASPTVDRVHTDRAGTRQLPVMSEEESQVFATAAVLTLRSVR